MITIRILVPRLFFLGGLAAILEYLIFSSLSDDILKLYERKDTNMKHVPKDKKSSDVNKKPPLTDKAGARLF